MGLQIVLFFLMLIVGAESSEVPCDYTTPVCDCSLTDDETCEIKLIIQKLKPFTRYKITDNGMSIDTNKGTEWYIDSTTGNLRPREEPTNDDVCKYITVESTACTQPFTVDGKSMRSFIAINGRAPGPTLILNKDQYLVVNVINKLNEKTSIHWHGMHQKNTHWMDGVEHVTQCGIPSNGSFTYIFQAMQTGTHWYHSHSKTQRTIGLFGALIVREQKEDTSRLGYDFEDMPGLHTLTFLDWQDEKVSEMDETEMGETIIRSLDEAEVSDHPYCSGLINGKGRRENDNYSETLLSIFTVSSDNTYRFRLIGAQDIFAYRVSVDEHKLMVIATDGAFVEKQKVDYIIIHSGERYDFLLKTKTSSEIGNSKPENFMIRAETLEKESHSVEAILHYDINSVPNSTRYKSINDSSTPVSSCCNSTYNCTVLNCPFREYPPSYKLTCIHIHNLTLKFPDLIPDDNLPALQVRQDDKLFFNFGFEGPKEMLNSMNARNMKLPTYPFSLSVGDTEKSEVIEKEKCQGIKNDSNTCNDGADDCKCVHVRDTKKDRSIQMILSNVLPGETDTTDELNKHSFAHPVHLHGHYMHVVAIKFGDYKDGKLIRTNKEINCGGTNKCNNPKLIIAYEHGKTDEKIIHYAPLKDTLLIPAGGYAVVYFKANNPGYWFIHCHIEPHVLGGMSAVIAEDIDNTKCPPMEMLKCGSFPDYTVDQFKIDREAIREGNCNDGSNNNNEGDDGNNNEGDDGNNNEGDDGNNNTNEGDDGNNNDEGGHHGEGHHDGGNVVKFEIILITLLCIGVLWSTN